jgi:nucleotide-binding universal stress UspA family protein
MTIRSIFVPVRGDGKGEGVLNHALALARRSNAHVEVYHCRPRPQDMLPLGTYLNRQMREQITASAKIMADEEEKRLRALFEDYCATHDLVVADAPPWPQGRMSASWHEQIGKQSEIISLYGRLADVVAVARPDREGVLGHNSLEAAVFATGRLTLMCPPVAVEHVGRHVAVAWNGSEEAARAVFMALGLLSDGDAVTVFTGETSVLPGADLGAYLASHGIKADLRQIKSAKTGVAQALLGGAAEAGADMLLMGAYGQSRQRELIMGGVTRHVIDHAAMPVMLTH